MTTCDLEKENLHVEKRKKNEASVKVLKWFKCTSKSGKRILGKKKKKVDKKFWRYFLDLANTTLFFSFDSIKKN